MKPRPAPEGAAAEHHDPRLASAAAEHEGEKGPERAFFGRRIGHPLRPRQRALFDHLLPRLALDLTRPAPADLREVFPVATAGARLEIGFGAGEHFLRQAAARPNVGFIGCEPFANGMAAALAALEAEPRANVRLHGGDAAALLSWLPAGSLERIDLLYPDPWPKRRHWKRRFVQAARVANFARVLRPGGAFHFASDVPDYVAWTLALFTRSDAFAWTAERADDWRLPPPGHAETRYERKARLAGRVPAYLIFRRV